MPKSWRKYLTRILLALAGGAAVGWLYGHVDWGLLIAALVLLAWQARQLLTFENALSQRKLDHIPYGESIWTQMLARYSHLKQRNRLHKKRYKTLLKEVRKSANALPDGGIVLNSDHEVKLCNKAAKSLVGFRPRRDRGQRVDNILRDPEFVNFLKSGKFSDGIEIRSPVHEDHWLFCRLVPYAADQTLLLIRDVTQAKRMSTARREFAANASHELRSPLTVVSGYLDSIAEDPDVPDHWRKPLLEMQNQTNRMNNIVSELLELSHLECSDVVAENQVVDVAGLLSAANKSLAGNDDVPAINIEIESRAQLLGSNVEIESVIGNLLSNAIRHTPSGGSITLRWRDSKYGTELVVIDNGEGIAPEYIPRITERFFRVDPGRSRDDGGIGLGLAIVKHALSRHDAILEVQSEIGKGSQFTCRFPASRIADKSALESDVTKT